MAHSWDEIHAGNGQKFYHCCRICGKVSVSESHGGAGFCQDGTQLEFVPSRKDSEPVCGSVKIGYMQYEMSSCRRILEDWIIARIDEGWQGFPCKFPSQAELSAWRNSNSAT